MGAIAPRRKNQPGAVSKNRREDKKRFANPKGPAYWGFEPGRERRRG